jgi:uncharacterized protein DUF3866
MLELRRGRVVSADGARLEVDLGDERAAAWADVGLVGPCEAGDEVVVNVQARRLGLGSGGFDVVHCNLTRGLDADDQAAGAHVMKLNYTSLQHAVDPVETRATDAGPPLGRPVAVALLHGQLPAVAWAFGRAAPGARLGYVQTAGGALPGALSDAVRDLRARGVLAGHVTAGPAYGGDAEAITAIGALVHGLGTLDWDAAITAPGPGIIGSGSRFGHGGLAALDAAHAALAAGCDVVVAARMSDSDPRPRHQGISHHTATVLDLLLGPVTVALPPGRLAPPATDRHHWVPAAAELYEDYAASGLPVTSMGREDRLFFEAALAAGHALAGMIPRR